MAKKRAELSTERRKTSSKSLGRTDQPSNSANSSSNSNLPLGPQNLIIIFIVIPAISVIVYRTLYGPTAATIVPSVYDRNLVKAEVKYQEIIAVRYVNE